MLLYFFYREVVGSFEGAYRGAELLVPKVWADENSEVKKVRLTSRPLPRPFDVESWAVIQVKKGE